MMQKYVNCIRTLRDVYCDPVYEVVRMSTGYVPATITSVVSMVSRLDSATRFVCGTGMHQLNQNWIEDSFHGLFISSCGKLNCNRC